MTKDIDELAVQIVRFVDDNFPGWVECQFTDATGRIHALVDKYPTFTTQMLDADSHYPQPGTVQCEVWNRTQDAHLGELVHIRMLSIESTEGLSDFVGCLHNFQPFILPHVENDAGQVAHPSFFIVSSFTIVGAPSFPRLVREGWEPQRSADESIPTLPPTP